MIIWSSALASYSNSIIFSCNLIYCKHMMHASSSLSTFKFTIFFGKNFLYCNDERQIETILEYIYNKISRE
jgi:hypothetical protein